MKLQRFRNIDWHEVLFSILTSTFFCNLIKSSQMNMKHRNESITRVRKVNTAIGADDEEKYVNSL